MDDEFEVEIDPSVAEKVEEQEQTPKPKSQKQGNISDKPKGKQKGKTPKKETTLEQRDLKQDKRDYAPRQIKKMRRDQFIKTLEVSDNHGRTLKIPIDAAGNRSYGYMITHKGKDLIERFIDDLRYDKERMRNLTAKDLVDLAKATQIFQDTSYRALGDGHNMPEIPDGSAASEAVKTMMPEIMKIGMKVGKDLADKDFIDSVIEANTEDEQEETDS